MMTISTLGLFSLVDFLNTMLELKKKYGTHFPTWTVNLLRFPAFMSGVNLPDHLKKMVSLLNHIKDPDLLHDLYFALAKAYEDIGEYEESFGHLREGNGILDYKYGYDIKKDSNLFENLKNFFQKSNLENLELK